MPFETAHEHVCRSVPVFGPDTLAGDMVQALRVRSFDLVSHIAICEGGRLLGIVRVEKLLPAPPEATAADVMDRDPATVAPGLDREQAAWHAVQQGESAIAVLDEAGQFTGFIPPERLLEVLLWEHEEDLSRISGVLHRQSAALKTQDESMLRRLWHRLPWLAVGLAGALVAARLVEAFREPLARSLLLTMFLPGIVYLADAVGTQTETLVVRGLSLGMDFSRVLWKEIWTGLAIGLALALAFLGVSIWLWDDRRVLGVVALALFAASAVAVMVAMFLPWLLDRFGIDPALGSGPLATVIQDLLSITIYFAMAEAILG